MCLDQLEALPKLKKEHGHYIGWKTYRGYDTKEKQLFPMWQGKCQVIGTWLNEKDYRSRMDRRKKFLKTEQTNQKYCFGFHLFLRPPVLVVSFPPGIAYHIRKVYFDGVAATGLENGINVIVAKKMKILRQRKVDCRSKKSE
jgi:hypothetical protein